MVKIVRPLRKLQSMWNYSKHRTNSRSPVVLTLGNSYKNANFFRSMNIIIFSQKGTTRETKREGEWGFRLYLQSPILNDIWFFSYPETIRIHRKRNLEWETFLPKLEDHLSFWRSSVSDFRYFFLSLYHFAMCNFFSANL